MLSFLCILIQSEECTCCCKNGSEYIFFSISNSKLFNSNTITIPRTITIIKY